MSLKKLEEKCKMEGSKVDKVILEDFMGECIKKIDKLEKEIKELERLKVDWRSVDKINLRKINEMKEEIFDKTFDMVQVETHRKINQILNEKIPNYGLSKTDFQIGEVLRKLHYNLCDYIFETIRQVER